MVNVCIFPIFDTSPMNRHSPQYQSTNPFPPLSHVYRYGFQAQEQDRELWEGAVSFKYRVEDARLGRFFSVDPLFRNYSYNSCYAFSENRIIDCRELEGAELIDADDARLKVVAGEVMIRLENFSDTYQKSFKNITSGLDHRGNPTIGQSTVVGDFGIRNLNSGKFEHPAIAQIPGVTYFFIDEATGKPIEVAGPGLDNKGRSELFTYKGAVVAKSTGQEDRRVNQYKPFGGPGKVGINSLKGLLALQSLALISDCVQGIKENNEYSEISQSEKAMNFSLDLVSKALNDNLIPEKYQNIQDISRIANMAFDGSGNEGFINLNSDGRPAGINQKAIDLQATVNLIISNYATEIKNNGYNPPQLKE